MVKVSESVQQHDEVPSRPVSINVEESMHLQSPLGRSPWKAERPAPEFWMRQAFRDQLQLISTLETEVSAGRFSRMARIRTADEKNPWIELSDKGNIL